MACLSERYAQRTGLSFHRNSITFDMTLKTPLMLIFFTTVGLGASVKLLAILLFLLLTGPTASNALASAALLSGQKPGQMKLLKEEGER